MSSGNDNRIRKCRCGHELIREDLSRHCGAYVCPYCGAHYGLARCYCGWSADGGDGYRQLLEDGETIEADY